MPLPCLRHAAVVAALTLRSVTIGHTQDPPLRDALRDFRGEISRITDTTALRQVDRRLGRTGDNPDGEAVRRMRQGLVRLRIGELGDGWSFGRAAGEFSRATELEPEWTEAWQARGLAKRAEGQWLASDSMNIGKRVGLGPIRDAVRSFARAIGADPTNAAAGAALFEAALELRDTAEFRRTTLPALRQVALAEVTDLGVLLAVAQAERFMGDSLAAVAAAERYLARGGSRGLGLRELAWSGFVAGNAGADSAYYAGAEADDSASVAGYRQDLALIADGGTLALFDRTLSAGRADWLRQFWTDKGREALRPAEERLREHYRRLTYAERHFGLEVNRRHYAILRTDMYRSGSTRFDDRGIVYLRYGPPDQRVATVTFDIMPNETWRYHRADGDLLLHFAANHGGDIRDYRLVPSIASVEGVSPGNADKAATWFAFNDRCPLYPPFCKVLSWGPYGLARVMTEERHLVTLSAAWAVSTDGFELRFARPLEAAAVAFAVGRTPDGQLAHLVYQVALEVPDTLSADAVFRLPLRVRADLIDAAGHSGGWIDTMTTVLLQGSDLAREAVDAVGRVTVVVPPGRWRYRLALSTGDSTGVVLPADSLEVASFDGNSLTLSDLVLSKSRRGARWVPEEGDTAYFNPRRVWLQSDTLALYHEIYGLAAGSGYSARLVVRKGRRAALTLQWDGIAAGEVTRVNRTLSFATVRPGSYELEVEVRDSAGRKAVSSRRLRITD